MVLIGKPEAGPILFRDRERTQVRKTNGCQEFTQAADSARPFTENGHERVFIVRRPAGLCICYGG
jgi:hypothetical protein